MRRGALGAVLLVSGGLALAGCGSSGPSATSSTTSTTNAAALSVRNLPVSSSVRAGLLTAAAAKHSLPASDFTGLTKGLTFYAYDPADGLYWAGAGLTPKPSSQAAGVSVQDDGGYTLFTKSANGPWTAYLDGLGTVPGTVCVIKVPNAVRAVWGWSLHTPCGGPAN
jgi:hypothetical protein